MRPGEPVPARVLIFVAFVFDNSVVTTTVMFVMKINMLIGTNLSQRFDAESVGADVTYPVPEPQIQIISP